VPARRTLRPVARVVIVGAGMGGLAAAARLARLRHDVVVCEQGPGAGGQVGTVSRDGFAFDAGGGLLTLPAAYRDLFIKTGKTVPLEKVLDLEPVDPAMRWRFADGVNVDVPNTSRADSIEAISRALGPGTGQTWDAFVAAGCTLWETFRRGFNDPPPTRRRDALRTPDGRRRTAALTPARTLSALARAHLQDPRLRQVAGSYATWAGSDPRRAGASTAVLPYIEQTFGTWRAVGGMTALVAAVTDRATLRGAKFRFDTRVEALTIDAGRVSGVRLAGGETLPADLVIAAVDARLLYGTLLPRPAGTAGAGRDARADRSASAFTVLLALRGAGDPTGPRHTVSFGADPNAEAEDVFGDRARPCPDPTMHVFVGDPASAPAGHEAWTLSVTAARHGGGDGALDWAGPGVADGYADALLATLARRGLDVRDRLLWRVVRSPADLERAIGSPGGATAGPALHKSAALFRPPNVTGVPGLFHVGASAHPGPGVPMAALSAALVAGMIGRA
jgi:phytoene desaturase